MQTYIKKIVLQGFKSFNKRVSIPLARGFNVICGPNGSGKSNIIDAICFVLGKTSPKSLRASRLNELIHHGLDGRVKADYASVTIYLDNSKKIFPFETEEVSIQRKVNQKGICVYKINGKVTTRERVIELLSIARIHPDGHNIIMQGDVTRIIEMSPVERRQVIDEISGIAEYNEKKEKAMKDLEVVEQKLREAEILVNERYEIFKRLERERNAALRYKELQKELLTLKASLAKKKVESLESSIKNLEGMLKEKEKEMEELQKEIGEVERSIEELQLENKRIIEELVEISKSIDLERKISSLRADLLVKRSKLSFHREEMRRIDETVRRLEELLPKCLKFLMKVGIEGVYGSVENLIKVPDEYRIAVEVALGKHASDIVVENEDVAKACIELLKKEKVGYASFLPLSRISPKSFLDNSYIKREGIIGVASNLVTPVDEKFRQLVDFLLGNTLVVKDFDSAKEIGIGRCRMVTLDGELFETTGRISGGFLERRSSSRIIEQIEGLKERKVRLEEECKRLEHDILELEGKLEELGEVKKVSPLTEVERRKIRIEEKLKGLMEKKRRLYSKRLKLQNEINRLSIQKAKLEAAYENAKIDLQQYGEDVVFLDQDIETLQRRIREVSSELDSLGPVNFKAIEEFERFKEEFEKFKERYEKILEEKKAVLEMIERIEEKRKEVFYKCLNEVGKHFNEIFKEVTGGEASLELEDPNDLESGLIIYANPAGKRTVNIDAMSGGEKSLTALAFILAIQKFRPAAFYALDEVDAALDKENSRKVAEMISKFSKEAQFIVVTHNDVTIQIADTVFGCSMVDGESKIIGLRMP